MLGLNIFFILTATVVYGQHVCPSCSDPYDYKSCTGVRTCHNTHEICMVRIDTQLNNRIEYYCTDSHLCSVYASHVCNPVYGQTCYFCCNELVACTGMREAIFYQYSWLTQRKIWKFQYYKVNIE